MGKFKVKGPERFEIDEQGIPYVNYGTVRGVEIGKQRNPVTISQKAMAYFEDYIQRGDLIIKQHLVNNADWLIAHSKKNKDFWILEYNFPWPAYNLPANWRSGMAQGEAIRALICAHKVTGNQKYLDSAKLLLNSFFIEIKDGGVTLKLSDNEWWYEEYAHEDARISRVLNGMMFALLDIHEYFKHTNDSDAKLLFKRGVQSLVNTINIYDFNGYSYYDILKKPSGEKYHNIHIALARQLFDITNQDIFNHYHERWRTSKPPKQNLIFRLARRISVLL